MALTVLLPPAILAFSLHFPFVIPYVSSAALSTYIPASYHYDNVHTRFDNTAWTYGTDYFLTAVMGTIAWLLLVVVYGSIVPTVTILLRGIVGVLRLVDIGGGICSSDCGGRGDAQYHSVSNVVDRLRGECEFCQLLDGTYWEGGGEALMLLSCSDGHVVSLAHLWNVHDCGVCHGIYEF
eukprot:CCRYP_021045-RA/>CCRYP_021045-RA protein AED:0.36 eAED:0.36 QI:0/-1/0/1/-1/1/1/0/179